MKLNYYAETDSLYIDFSANPSVDSKAVSDDLIIDFDEHGKPVGIGIEHASEKLNLSELITHDVPVKKIAVG